MGCHLARITSSGMTTHTCHEVRFLYPHWKRKFRTENSVEEIEELRGRDSHYDSFCAEIDLFLDECKCDKKIKDLCEKCSKEDHEGDFCRCEMRNLILAKQRRE